MLGPPTAGVTTQYIGFPWATSLTAFIQGGVVRTAIQIFSMWKVVFGQ